MVAASGYLLRSSRLGYGGDSVKRILIWVLAAVAVVAVALTPAARYHHYSPGHHYKPGHHVGAQPADMYVQPTDMYGQPADMY
jgi:hypothetical protein